MASDKQCHTTLLRRRKGAEKESAPVGTPGRSNWGAASELALGRDLERASLQVVRIDAGRSLRLTLLLRLGPPRPQGTRCTSTCRRPLALRPEQRDAQARMPS